MARLIAIALLLAGTFATAETQALDNTALERLVRQDCGSCHGFTLKGGLGPDIRPNALSHYDHDTLKLVIAGGIPGTPMPPWEPLLTKDELDWIVTYLLTGDEK